MTIFLEVLLVLSVVAAAARHLSARRAVREALVAPRNESFLPPVSLLKPLKGVDDGLFDNLASFFRLDYPEFEIVFCLQSPHDPALRVVNRLRDRFPGVPVQVVVEDRRAALNPKVDNMIPGCERSRHEVIVISDSNVKVRPDYLREAVSHLSDPSVGLVSHLVRGVGGKTVGARLENDHLNSAILPSVAFMDRVASWPCVVGKSMVMRKADLESIGGLAGLGDYLAEDYVSGEKMAATGKRVVISGSPVDTVNVYRTTKEFWSRHARWNRMRRAIAGPAYLAEAMTAPALLALPLLLVDGFGSSSLLLSGAALVAKASVDAANAHILGARWTTRNTLLAPVRDLFAAALFLSAFFSNKVAWRGRTLRIERGSRLVPVGGPAFPPELATIPTAVEPASEPVTARNETPAEAVA